MNLFKRTNAPVLKSNRPQDPFSLMNEMMNNMWTEGSYGKDFSPSVEVKETKTDYSVIAELAGMNKEDIDVHFENNTLYLKGEKKYEKKSNEDEKVQYTERYYGSFMRNIPFADEIDTQKIDADFKNGLLTIKLAKKPIDRSYTSKITVK
jgi:HSP20 family protein